MKVAATRGYGARGGAVRPLHRGPRGARAAQLAQERGLTLIPPYDHPHVIAGQGTAVKELLEEAGPLDALFVCLGGGGLLAGSALSARALAPACKVYGVEPEAGNDGQQSFRAGRIVHIETPRTIADGAQTQHLGEHTFAIIRRDVDDIHTATDAAAGRGHALLRRAHEDAGGAHRLPRPSPPRAGWRRSSPASASAWW